RSKVSGLPLRQGDVVTIETSGGGGHGDPAARDPAALRRDLELGFVTAAAAARDYGTPPKENEA
ncbi:MAG: hypothetical protein B7Z14_19100, partial [Bosea sp. 32-68-6]